MQEYQLDFVTYCVGNLADRLNMSASKVYKMLRSTDILNGYMCAGLARAHFPR